MTTYRLATITPLDISKGQVAARLQEWVDDLNRGGDLVATIPITVQSSTQEIHAIFRLRDSLANDQR